MFGPHLIAEMHNCSRDKLMDTTKLKETLNTLPDKMGMTKITEPCVWEYSGMYPDDWGLSGIVIIAESHLAFHTFPDKGFMTVDIFSCKDFDTSFVMRYLAEIFEPESWDEQLIQRGREFPRSMTRAKLIIDNDRQQASQAILV